AHAGEHAAQLFSHFFHARWRHDLHLGHGLGDFDLDLRVIQLAFAQALAEYLAGTVLFALGLALRVTRRRNQHIENAVFGGVLSQRAHAPHGGFARELDRCVDEVAHDGLDIAAHITHFGELGGFDLDEGGV